MGEKDKGMESEGIGEFRKALKGREVCEKRMGK